MVLPLALGLTIPPTPAHAHDPSAWGGLFRSRDGGLSWFPANPGRIVSGALALTVDPEDPAHLLLGTDSGLLRSRNGGLDWTVEAPGMLVGPVFAVALDVSSRRVFAATTTRLFREADGGRWEAVSLPTGAAPVRLLASVAPGHLLLAGMGGLFGSDDGARTWTDLGARLPDRGRDADGAFAPRTPVGSDPRPGALGVTAIVPAPGKPREIYVVVVDGRIFATEDDGTTLRARSGGLSEQVDALAVEPDPGRHLWLLAGGRIHRSRDQGATWAAVGQPLPDSGAVARGLVVGTDGRAVTVATDRGLYRSEDSGATWDLLGDNLPAHLEAGLLLRDPHDPQTLYAGFALTPYGELWRQAVEGGVPLARVGVWGWVGAAAVLALLTGGAGLGLRRLARHAAAGPGGTRRAATQPDGGTAGRLAPRERP